MKHFLTFAGLRYIPDTMGSNIPKKILFSPYLWLIAILVITLLLYLQVYGFTWITGLDQQLVIENVLISTFSGNNLYDLLFSTTEGRYQPLSFISYGVDILFSSGQSSRTIHLVNLILHMLNIILFFRIVQLVSNRVWIAFTAVLIFAVHPLNVEAVAWMSVRAYLLCSFFLLLAGLSYIYKLKSVMKKKRHLILSAVFFVLALLSHPIAVVFPGMALLLDYSYQKDMRKALTEKAYFIVLTLIFIVIALFGQNANFDTRYNSIAGIPERLLYIPYILSDMFLHFLVPFRLSAHHPVPSNLMYAGLVSLTGFAAFIVILIIAYSRNKLVFVSILFFIGSLLLSVLFSYSMPGIFNESDAYIPFMGLSVSAGVIALYMYDKVRIRNKILSISLILIAFAYIAFLSYSTFLRIPVWKNSERLWTNVIQNYPDNDRAFFLRGDFWAMNGRFDRAKFDYNQCVKRNPEAYEAINNYGLILMEEGELRLALAEFTRSIGVYDRFYKSHLNRGVTYMRIGNNDMALADINKAIDLESNVGLLYYNRGLVYERLNALEEAIVDFTKAIQLEPTRLIYYKDRGKAYTWMQNFQFAEMDYTKAISLDPSNGELWFRRSLSRSSQEKYDEGLEDALMAQSLGFPVDEEYIKGLTVHLIKDEIPEQQ